MAGLGTGGEDRRAAAWGGELWRGGPWRGERPGERVPRWLVVVDAVVAAVGLTIAGIGFPAGPDSGFADRLMTAIGARTDGGTVSCTIPGDLDPGRRFECHGVDALGGYSVEVTILDPSHDFRLAVARAV